MSRRAKRQLDFDKPGWWRLPLDADTPKARRTRSGRTIYGAHPFYGPLAWTDKPGSKLDRRRVRSRIAAAWQMYNERCADAERKKLERVVRDIFGVEMEGSKDAR